MRELKSLLGLLLGFMPWLLFLFLSGHTLYTLERATIISLAASLILGFSGLRQGFILQWGTLAFFLAGFILVNIMTVVWVAENMGILTNAYLAALMWFTVIIGKPFALQYARSDLPKERWNDPNLIRSCRFITVVWGLLMTFAACVSIFRKADVVPLPDWVYFDISLLIIIGGVTYTTIYKRQKRLQRERAQSPAG